MKDLFLFVLGMIAILAVIYTTVVVPFWTMERHISIAVNLNRG
jgi:hypothetical protein